jgi:metallo-beta-lactamase family protein
MAATLAGVVARTCAEGGKVIIPAFSLGRTQLVVHYLQAWMRAGVLPRLPIFVDSPLAAHIAEIYEQYPDQFDVEPPPWDDPCEVYYLRSREDSDGLASWAEPCIIVASGGMCEGGRIVRHLREYVDDPRCSLVMVSYQAPGTLGRQLLEPGPRVRFHGRTWNKWINVAELNGFSGHADHQDLLHYLTPLAGNGTKVRLVHGDVAPAELLATDLRALGFADVEVPAREETVAVG